MNKKLNVGVAGLGRLGSLYARYLAFQIPEANVIAVNDANKEHSDKIAQEIGAKASFADYHDMLDMKDLDAIVITTPTSTHRDIVVDAASKGKAVFCEKPLTISMDEAVDMKDAVAKSGIFFHMGFMRRFDRGYSAAKSRILDGEIGDPIVFKASSRDPFRPSLEFADPAKSGGLFLDMGIHDIDLARWFMGDVSEVYSIGNILAYPEMATINDIDNAIFNLKFTNGTLGNIDLSRSGIYGYDIRTEILGTKGTIQIGYLRETPITILKKEGVTHDTVPYFMERFEQAYIIQLRDFVTKVIDQKEPSISINDGQAALLVGHAADASFKQSRPIHIDNESMQFSAVNAESEKAS